MGGCLLSIPVSYHVLQCTETRQINQIVKIQEQVWGDDVTSAAQLIATIRNGGSVIVALAGEEVVGFTYCFPGYKHGSLYLCSHMAAVIEAYRGQGIGRGLKLKQREWAQAHGFEKIEWTFDPLEARNAFLNLCKLGGYIKDYVPSYYGDLEDNINRGLPSDRFILSWDLASAKVTNAIASSRPITPATNYPQLISWTLRDDIPVPYDNQTTALSPTERHYLVAVPANIAYIKVKDFEVAKKWRKIQRSIFILAFSMGYRINYLYRGNQHVHYYLIEKDEHI